MMSTWSWKKRVVVGGGKELKGEGWGVDLVKTHWHVQKCTNNKRSAQCLWVCLYVCMHRFKRRTLLYFFFLLYFYSPIFFSYIYLRQCLKLETPKLGCWPEILWLFYVPLSLKCQALSMHMCVHDFLCVSWGFELRSSCFPSQKCFSLLSDLSSGFQA